MGSSGLRLTGAVECGNLRFSQRKASIFGSENIKLTHNFHIQRLSMATGWSVGGIGWHGESRVTALRCRKKWHEARP